jgi:hypothetical protein
MLMPQSPAEASLLASNAWESCDAEKPWNGAQLLCELMKEPVHGFLA